MNAPWAVGRITVMVYIKLMSDDAKMSITHSFHTSIVFLK